MADQPKQLTNIIINGEKYLISDETVQTILEVIWNNNGAISSRINDLNQRVLTNTNDIEDNAYVTAIALNDLNDRISNSSLDLDSLEIAYENLKSYVLTTYNNINTSYNRLYSYTTVQLGTLNTGYNNLKSYILTTYNNVKTSYEILKKSMDNNVVHKTGNETISGNKTFNDNIYTNRHSLIEHHIPELITGDTLKFDWISIHADLTEENLTLQQALDERNNVQADWNETNTLSYTYIKNKPYIPTKVSDLTNDSDYATKTYVRTEVSNLVNSAPETLDTLNELAAALGNDPNFATTVATQIGNINTGYNNLKSYVLTTYNNVKTSYDTLNSTVSALTNTFKLKNDYAYSSLSNEALLLAPNDSYNVAFGKLEKAILDNEEIVTLALTDLNDKISNITDDSNDLKSYVLTTYNNVKTSYDTLNTTVANSYSYLLNAYLAFYEEYDRDSYLMTKLFIQLHENIEDLNNNKLSSTYISYLNSLRTDVDDKIPNSYKSVLDNCFNDKLSIIDYNNDSYVIIKSLFDLNDKYAYVYDKYSYLYDEYDTDMYVLANSLIDLDSRTKEFHDYVEDSTYVITNSLIDLDTRNYEIIDSYNALKAYTTIQIGTLNTGYSNLETYTTTQINNLINTKYVANLQTSTSISYITEPEVKTVKINGSTTNSASTENCILQYDTTNKCLNFVFN